jgi:hypothetical protein
MRASTLTAREITKESVTEAESRICFEGAQRIRTRKIAEVEFEAESRALVGILP